MTKSISETEDLVGEEGISMRRLGPGIGLFGEPPGDLGAAFGEGRLEDRRRLLSVGLVKQDRDRAAIDDLALIGDHRSRSAWRRFSL